MKFLCGRPGCGKESTATLQIDAPSETVSLVDPRISRDGVPLCARHADATTPPMGWTMNDLRSRNRALSAVPDEGTVPTSTPPRVRPDRSGSPAAGGDAPGAANRNAPGSAHMSPRQSIAERARQTGGAGTIRPGRSGVPEVEEPIAQPAVAESAPAATVDPAVAESSESSEHRFRSSRIAGAEESRGGRGAARADGRRERKEEAPASRPTRRRDVAEEGTEEEDRFPWHFQYQDDEPAEMQASSPLLSRAFRSSTG